MADIEINLESTDSKELLKSGHHAYITKDYSNAVAALGKATQIMAQEHGDEHDSLGEVYLHYARALLELSREESEPLGDAIPQGDDSEDDEEQPAEDGDEDNAEDGDENEKEDDSAEKKEEENKEDETKEDEKVEDSKEKETKETMEVKDEEKVTNGTTNGETKSDEAAAGPSTSNGDESTEVTEQEAEPSDLQLAWEVLEVAKKIFTARGDSGKELLSQTLILLGEVSMESENFEEAANDIQSGLELQEGLYEKTSRKLAETQYKLGIAHGTVSNLDEAITFFEKSINTLQGRIDMLKEKDDDISKKEIKEMEELIPEIKEKINDMNTVKEERAKVVKELADACNAKVQKSETTESTSSPKEVKDISHLVKRKRKTEEHDNEINPAKKPTP